MSTAVWVLAVVVVLQAVALVAVLAQIMAARTGERRMMETLVNASMADNWGTYEISQRRAQAEGLIEDARERKIREQPEGLRGAS